MQITQSQFNNLVKGAYLKVQTEAPYKKGRPLKHPTRSTGNLKYNALKIEQVGNYHWVIYIDENVAPYMPYTNEPWIAEKWKGAKNPNLYWFDNVAHQIIRDIQAELNKIASKQVADWWGTDNVAGWNLPDSEEKLW